MSKELSEKYVKLSGIEHVLQRPDTYIGSLDKELKSLFVATNFENDLKDTKMVYQEVNYSAGFIKIFDEAITNASDHAIRTGKVSYIKVSIEDDVISIENDGPGVPVVIHTKEKIYIPVKAPKTTPKSKAIPAIIILVCPRTASRLYVL